MDEADLLAMLPAIPAWWMPGINEGPNGDPDGMAAQPGVRWQEDREFLDRYYRPPERRQEGAARLRAAATQLIDLLKTYPLTALTPRPARAKGEPVMESR